MPNMQDLKNATEKVDPFFDRLLAWATASAWTPWLIAGWTIASVLVGIWIGLKP